MSTGPDGTITVLVADDHASIRTGLRMVVDLQPDLTVVGEASDGSTAVAMVRALDPEVVLMDLRMPGVNGVEATREIAGGRTRVLVLTTFDLDEYVAAALRAGASGYLLKTVEPADLAAAVRAVATGDGALSPEVVPTVIRMAAEGAPPAGTAVPAPAPLEPLTVRERDVLTCLGAGLSNQQIARRLGIAPTTVKTHVSSVLTKLGLSSRVQAALWCREHGSGPQP